MIGRNKNASGTKLVERYTMDTPAGVSSMNIHVLAFLSGHERNKVLVCSCLILLSKQIQDKSFQPGDTLQLV